MKDRIEWLMSVIHVCKVNLVFYLDITGNNSLFLCRLIDTTINNNDFELVEDMNIIFLTDPFDALALYNP